MARDTKKYRTIGQERPIVGALTGECPVKIGDKIVIPAGTEVLRDKEPSIVLVENRRATVKRIFLGYDGDEKVPKTNPRVYWDKGYYCDINKIALLTSVVLSATMAKVRAQNTRKKDIQKSVVDSRKSGAFTFADLKVGDKFLLTDLLTKESKRHCSVNGSPGKIQIPSSTVVKKVSLARLTTDVPIALVTPDIPPKEEIEPTKERVS